MSHLDVVYCHTCRQDTLEDARGRCPWCDRKLQCPKGHRMNQANTAVRVRRQGPTRECRTCENDRQRSRYWRRKPVAA